MIASPTLQLIKDNDIPSKSKSSLSKYNTAEWFQEIQIMLKTDKKLVPQSYDKLLKAIQQFRNEKDLVIPNRNFTPNCFWFMICAEYFSRKGYIVERETSDEIFHETISLLEAVEFERNNILKNQTSNDFDVNNDSQLKSKITGEIGYLKKSEIDMIEILLNIENENLINFGECLKNWEKLQEYFLKNKYLEQSNKEKIICYSKPNIKQILRKSMAEDLIQKKQLSLSNWIKSSKATIEKDRYNQRKIQLSEFQLSFLIDYLENEANKLKESSAIKFNEIKEKMIEEYKNLLPIIRFAKKSEYNILMDLDNNSIREKEFFDYLETKHHNSKILTFESIDGYYNNNKNFGVHEIVCQICNDGDFSDDNLIVFCCNCDMTIHQKCYDLSQIPAGDWICDLCRSFGSRGKYMPCPFCSRTGGAMKPTDYLKTQNIPNTNQNSNFHDFILKCLKSEKDFYSKKVWVHLSCALWMPGIYFEETNEIKGFDNVETWRFNIICEICKMVKVGAVIQCAYKECPRFFHVECGRRIGLYLENIEHNYLLYCQKHKPYKLKIVQITRFSKARDEITRYFKQLYRKPTDFRYNEKIKQNEIYTNSLFLINLKKIEGNYQVQKVFCPTLKKYNDQKQILKNIPIKNNSYLLNIDESTINADKKKTRDDNKKKNLFKAVKEKKTLQKQIQAKKIIFRKETRLNLRKIIKKSNKDGKKNNPIKIESELISIDYSTRLNNNDCQIIISLDNNNTSEINNVNSKLIGYELDKLNCICLEKCDYLKNNVIICMVCERKFHFKCIGFKGTLKDASDLKFVCKSCDLYGNFFARNVRRKLCCDFFENYYEDIDEKEKKRWGNALQELNSIDDNYWASEIEICMENSETEIDYKSEEKSKECENLSLSSLSLTS